MDSMRLSLEAAISEAHAASAGSDLGHVYVAGWRVDPLRDVTPGNTWATSGWLASGLTNTTDETAIGLFLRILEAGITLRIMLWCPTMAAGPGPENLAEHYYLYRLIQQKCSDLGAPGRGVVALDTRIGAIAGAHHQKMMVIRGAGSTHVAYCGGVDLAFRGGPGKLD